MTTDSIRPRSDNPSRRDFSRKSALAAAGASLAGGLSLARGAHAAGGDVIKIALIGCGGRGTGAAYNALQHASPTPNWS